MAWAHALHIDSHAAVVKSHAEAVPGVADIERLGGELRLAVFRVGESDIPGRNTGAAGKLLPQQRADSGIALTSSGRHRLVMRRQQFQRNLLPGECRE